MHTISLLMLPPPARTRCNGSYTATVGLYDEARIYQEGPNECDVGRSGLPGGSFVVGGLCFVWARACRIVLRAHRNTKACARVCSH